ncbi:MAG: hypothetical protein BWY36_00077 [Candidatus Diapherotrites archaeon ADurb.Bin253]|jgi:hypothetical protein|nr:MAG: hypothetical protein BWY36_00077 [Candidatus Diapherotrites archaeon ADurb.Bin253]
MSFDEVIKYLIWIIFFGIVLAGLFVMLKKTGVI